VDDYRDRIKKANEKFILKNDPSEIDRRRRARAAKPKKKREHPLESVEHRNFVRVLERENIFFIHVPNEGKIANTPEEAKRIGYKRKMFGVKAGCPDFLIFDPSPNGGAGCAIEMKRVKGSYPVWGRPEQQEFLTRLAGCGWDAYVTKGCEAATSVLEGLGYIERKRENENDTTGLIRRFEPDVTGGGGGESGGKEASDMAKERGLD
jgi:hypothetical protein